jgi:hypothetical protein
MSDKNYYRVVNPSCDTILHSSSPSGAAAKAFSKCFSKKSRNNKKYHMVSVQRRSGNQKIMSYKVKSVSNPKKMMVERDGKMIHYKYHTKVKSMNKSK